MKFAPHIIGAFLLVAVAGAVSGAAIGDAPILKRETQDSLPDAQPVSALDQAAHSTKRPPDQYALETPEGTVEVAELSLRGRLRNTAHAHWWRESGEASGPAADYAIEYGEEDLVRLAREEALIAFTSQPEPQPRPSSTRAEAPMTLAERPAPPPAPRPAEQDTIGNAKTIDVAAALAAQGR